MVSRPRFWDQNLMSYVYVLLLRKLLHNTKTANVTKLTRLCFPLLIWRHRIQTGVQRWTFPHQNPMYTTSILTSLMSNKTRYMHYTLTWESLPLSRLSGLGRSKSSQVVSVPTPSGTRCQNFPLKSPPNFRIKVTTYGHSKYSVNLQQHASRSHTG